MNKSRKLLNEVRRKMVVKDNGVTFNISGNQLIDWINRVDELGKKKPNKKK